MTDDLRCSGLLDGNVCVHGFRASVACWPNSREHAAQVAPPMCCDEERCGDLFEGMGGKPLHANGARIR